MRYTVGMSRVTPLAQPITIELDGHPVPAREGEPAAAALIAHGELLFARSPKYHRPRGPFCLSGACSQCLMRVDGVPNVPTCRVPARPGMKLERQNAMPDARLDLLRAADFVFQSWFNHHEFLTGIPIAESVLVKVARQLSGLGLLPDAPGAPRRPARLERQDTVVVGAGPAGLAVARRLDEAGQDFVLLERDEVLLGGEADEAGPRPWSPPSPQGRFGALVVGLFADRGRPFLAVVEGGALTLLEYERLVLAVGGHPVLPTFPNNDLPGVMAGRAVAALIRRHGILPGQRVACVGEPDEATALARLVSAAGGTAVATGRSILRAHGLARVEGATVLEGDQRVRYDCDVIATCGAVGPSFELARAAGAGVRWDATTQLFVVEADEDGRTVAPGLWVTGELLGPMSAETAAVHGWRVGGALLARGAP